MNVIGVIVQYFAVLLAVFLWTMAAFYLMKVSAAYQSVMSGRGGISKMRTSVLAGIAFKVAALVGGGLYVIRIADLIAGVL